MNDSSTTKGMSWLFKILDYYLKILDWLYAYLFPVFMLGVRLWMAKIFWYSGLTKLDDWNSTIFLFQYEYQVPVLSAKWAACLSTSFELLCPVLLVLGLATRLATLPMLAMTAVIQLTYMDLIDHYYWGILLSLILLYGPSKIAIDAKIKQYFIKRQVKLS